MTVEKSRVKLTNGWLKVTMDNGSARFYPPDGGDSIAAGTYYPRVKAGLIPKGETITSDIPQGFIAAAPAQNQTPELSTNEPSFTQSINEIPLPEAKSNTSRPVAGKATSKELAKGMETTLLVVTSLAGMFSGISELGMRQDEAKAISVPLANMLEGTEINKKYGKIIANSGDVQLCGFAAGQYGFRVSIAVKRRIEERRKRNEFSRANASAPTGGGNNGAEYAPAGGVTYRPALGGLRQITRTFENGSVG